MSRQKPNKPRRPRPVHEDRRQQSDEYNGEMSPAEVEFFAAMKKLADNTYEGAVAKLRKLGVPDAAIEHMETGVRAQCIAEIWELNLEKLFLDLVESEGQSVRVRDAVAEKLLRTPIFPRPWDDEDDEEEPVKA